MFMNEKDLIKNDGDKVIYISNLIEKLFEEKSISKIHAIYSLADLLIINLYEMNVSKEKATKLFVTLWETFEKIKKHH
jgi:hypothetical protein